MTPPFELRLYTGAEMLEVLQNAELVIDGFNTKMRVEYDDQDLKGLMEMAQREIQSSSQVLNVIVEEMVIDEAGNKERKSVFSKFIFDYNKGKEYFIICKN